MKKIFLTLTIMSLLCFSQQSFSNETTTENTISSLTEQANQGNANAQFNLGVMYAEGRGVSQDYQKAAEYFTKAANQSNSGAQYNLGIMYGNGQGVPQDTPKAKSLFKQDCLNKNQTSCNEYSKLNR